MRRLGDLAISGFFRQTVRRALQIAQLTAILALVCIFIIPQGGPLRAATLSSETAQEIAIEASYDIADTGSAKVQENLLAPESLSVQSGLENNPQLEELLSANGMTNFTSKKESQGGKSRLAFSYSIEQFVTCENGLWTLPLKGSIPSIGDIDSSLGISLEDLSFSLRYQYRLPEGAILIDFHEQSRDTPYGNGHLRWEETATLADGRWGVQVALNAQFPKGDVLNLLTLFQYITCEDVSYTLSSTVNAPDVIIDKAKLSENGLSSSLVTTLTNGQLSLLLFSDGNFIAKTAAGKPLLYPNNPTSSLTIRAGSTTYSHAGTGKTPWEGNATVYTVSPTCAYVDYTLGSTGLTARETFTLVGACIRLDLSVQNIGSQSVPTKVRLMLDTQIGANDGAPLAIGGNVYTYEYTGPFSHPYWYAYEASAPPFDTSLRAVGTLATQGELISFAWWPSVANGDAYDYTTSPSKSFSSDSCTLLYYDFGSLASGATQLITTYYGTTCLLYTSPSPRG